MQRLKRHVDGMFKELPRTRHARELKAEILANMEERAAELAEKNIDPEEVQNQLIAEIGTAADIRESITLDSIPRLLVVIGIQALLVVVAISYFLYARANLDHYSLTFEFFPYYIAILVAAPAARFFGVHLVANIVNFLIRPKQIFISVKPVRIVCFVLGFIPLGLWLLNAFFVLGIEVLGIESGWGFPPMITSVLVGVAKNSNLFAGVAGLLFYLGLKR